MKSIVVLETYQKIIQQEPANRNFCKNELRWIENRRLDWGYDRIRVGVIGVTSSGKSTLINAILGTDILSSAIPCWTALGRGRSLPRPTLVPLVSR